MVLGAPVELQFRDARAIRVVATLDCRYTYVRDNGPQGYAAVLLAASELEL